jgi:hypothetical protein
MTGADRVDLYAITASGAAAELYRQADAAPALDQEIRVLRVLTALLFEDPARNHAALVRVLPALIRALDLQAKLTGGGDTIEQRLAGIAEGVLQDLEMQGRDALEDGDQNEEEGW